MINGSGEFVACGYPGGMGNGVSKGRKEFKPEEYQHINNKLVTIKERQALVRKGANVQRRRKAKYGLPYEKLLKLAIEVRGKPFKNATGERIAVAKLRKQLVNGVLPHEQSDKGAYLPSKQAISSACAKIQRGWSENEKQSRISSAYRVIEALGVYDCTTNGVYRHNGKEVIT